MQFWLSEYKILPRDRFLDGRSAPVADVRVTLGDDGAAVELVAAELGTASGVVVVLLIGDWDRTEMLTATPEAGPDR